MTKALWDSIEQQFSATAGAQNVQPFMDIARARMQIQVTGITTTETNKNVRQVSCQATLTSTLPEVPNADYSLLRTAIAKETGGNVRLDDRTLTGSVEYRVQLSDDRSTTRVEAQGFRTFTEVVGGIASALYINDAQEKALGAEAAAKRSQSAQATPSEATTAPAAAVEPDVRAIAAQEYQAADKLLNEAYQAARATMTDVRRVALRDQQREWIKTRDVTCSAERIEADSKGDIAGGTAMELAIVGCKTRLTSERAKQLSDIKG
ncbi:MAG: DUF1311 domain-containing protein [Hydrogenophaga sp.]|nr:DUF1311 domain-containing protein [Hydrogenophaga sp.]